MTKHWPHSPGDTIKSAEDNDDKEGLAAGTNDYPDNSIFTFRKEAFDTFFARGGCIWSISSGRIGTMSAGEIYASSNGDRTDVSGIATQTFAATQDSYVFIHEQTGVKRTVTASVGGTPPTPNANEVLNAVITTNATAITKIVQYGYTRTNLPIFNTLPRRGRPPQARILVSASSISPVVDENQQTTVDQLAADTTIAAPSGSLIHGQTIIVNLRDNGTARNVAWDGIYRGLGVTLPGVTVANKWMYAAGKYNGIDNRVDILSVNRES
jgi:hypothetical protein